MGTVFVFTHILIKYIGQWPHAGLRQWCPPDYNFHSSIMECLFTSDIGPPGLNFNKMPHGCISDALLMHAYKNAAWLHQWCFID